VVEMRLNLGCGDDIKKGYINIDVRRTKPEVLQIDLEKELLRFFPDESADEIIAKDFIEHLSWRVVEDFLKDCFRVLKKGGRLFIQCPDLEVIANQVILNPDFKYGELEGYKAISFWIYGEQNYPENTHKSGFTKPAIKKLLEQIGFTVISLTNGGTNLLCEAVKP
jgi:predicted SAM-dependent methyltransferase